MFSNNLKRSVATLGVVAGLLAAAVPASACRKQGKNDGRHRRQAGQFTGGSQSGTMHVAAPTDRARLNANGGDDTLYARGTQVGRRDGFLDIGTTETLDMNAIPITADAGRATTISAARPSTSFPS